MEQNNQDVTLVHMVRATFHFSIHVNVDVQARVLQLNKNLIKFIKYKYILAIIETNKK